MDIWNFSRNFRFVHPTISCGTANDILRQPGSKSQFWKDAFASTEGTMTIVEVQNEENHEKRRRQSLSTL
jgi:hypothetical protein